MGRDKAFLEFQGVPMIQLAVERLGLVCDEVGILGNDPALARYGEVVPDELVECGPLSGIVQALRFARREWILITPVDMPLLPRGLLRGWVSGWMDEQDCPKVCCLADRGEAQPLVCMLHRSVGNFLEGALRRGERKVLPALRAAGGGGFRMMDVEDSWWLGRWAPTLEEAALREFWFGNANTPEELGEMERRAVEGRDTAHGHSSLHFE